MQAAQLLAGPRYVYFSDYGSNNATGSNGNGGAEHAVIVIDCQDEEKDRCRVERASHIGSDFEFNESKRRYGTNNNNINFLRLLTRI